LIGPNGENIGVVPMKQAMQIARDAEMDVVEVSPNATPPVCRVMDFGKFIYERAKKEREAKRAQTKIEVKEIRLRPKTNEAHRGFKVDDARRWLLQGNKVRVTIKFRGREMDYPEIALEDLKEIAAALAERPIGIVAYLASGDVRELFVKERSECAENAALRLPSKTEQNEVLLGENSVNDLRNDRVFKADDAGEERLVRAEPANEV